MLPSSFAGNGDSSCSWECCSLFWRRSVLRRPSSFDILRVRDTLLRGLCRKREWLRIACALTSDRGHGCVHSRHGFASLLCNKALPPQHARVLLRLALLQRLQQRLLVVFCWHIELSGGAQWRRAALAC